MSYPVEAQRAIIAGTLYENPKGFVEVRAILELPFGVNTLGSDPELDPKLLVSRGIWRTQGFKHSRFRGISDMKLYPLKFRPDEKDNDPTKFNFQVVRAILTESGEVFTRNLMMGILPTLDDLLNRECAERNMRGISDNFEARWYEIP